MSIGIVVSTEFEAEVLVGHLSAMEKSTIQQKAFYHGVLKETTRATICVCGVGKTNAAHGATLLIEKFGPGLVYNIGVAGAYPSSGLDVGDIAVAEREIYGDEGLMLGGVFCTMDTLGLPLVSSASVQYYNKFPLVVPERLKDFATRGTFVTVSSCTGTLERGREIERRLGAICENMEGAAVAHICALNGVPASEIRGISNIVEDRTAEPLHKAGIISASAYVQRFFLERLV